MGSAGLFITVGITLQLLGKVTSSVDNNIYNSDLDIATSENVFDSRSSHAEFPYSRQSYRPRGYRRKRRSVLENMAKSMTCLFYVDDYDETVISSDEEEDNPPILTDDDILCTCELPNGNLYELDFSSRHGEYDASSANTCLELVRNGTLVSAQSRLQLAGALVNRNDQNILLPPGPPLILDNEFYDKDVFAGRLRRRRQLGASGSAVGSKTFLVIKVVAPDKSDNERATSVVATEEELASKVFGSRDDPVNLKSQYDACSRGKFKVRPAPFRVGQLDGTRYQINNGVLTIETDVDVNEGRISLTNAVMDNIRQIFDLGETSPEGVLADIFLFCLPPNTKARAGTDGRMAVGTAEPGGWRAWFLAVWCTRVSAQMHEVGHLFSLGHSNDSTFEESHRYTYGGQTGAMGYVLRKHNEPATCFNAGHMYDLGWYDESAELLEVVEPPSESGLRVKLIGFASDFDKDFEGIRLIRVVAPSASSENIYLHYNAAVNYNHGTIEGVNQVTIVEKPERAIASTNLVAMLDVDTAPFAQEGFFGPKCDLQISVLRMNRSDKGGIAIVEIQSTGSGCHPTPTRSPSNAPSKGPSDAPSQGPSDVPSKGPSDAPSTGPTDEPSAEPSDTPSFAPSAVSSLDPSARPSIRPTGLPSLTPTETPSFSVSPSTSAFPSSAPSLSQAPSTSSIPSLSVEPSISSNPTNAPSSSTLPTSEPSLSQAPSMSTLPSLSIAPSMSSDSKSEPTPTSVPTTGNASPTNFNAFKEKSA